MVYSGDTRPDVRVERLARGATLLIHEATFEPGLGDEAVRKRHCTTDEALGVALRAGVERVVLTHFSQRYPKVPVWGGGWPQGGVGVREEDDAEPSTVELPVPILAFDGMAFSLLEALVLPMATARVAALLEEDEADRVRDDVWGGEGRGGGGAGR